MGNFPIVNKISRDEFFRLKERDLLFITNPGRMADVSGSTLIVHIPEGYKVYRIDGWYFENRSRHEQISYSEMMEAFPIWRSMIKSIDQKDNLLYKYINMGFGNGLCVKKDIHALFMQYLQPAIDQYAEVNHIDPEEKIRRRAMIIFSVWDKAVINMAADKNIVLL